MVRRDASYVDAPPRYPPPNSEGPVRTAAADNVHSRGHRHALCGCDRTTFAPSRGPVEPLRHQLAFSMLKVGQPRKEFFCFAPDGGAGGPDLAGVLLRGSRRGMPTLHTAARLAAIVGFGPAYDGLRNPALPMPSGRSAPPAALLQPLLAQRPTGLQRRYRRSDLGRWAAVTCTHARRGDCGSCGWGTPGQNRRALWC